MAPRPLLLIAAALAGLAGAAHALALPAVSDERGGSAPAADPARKAALRVTGRVHGRLYPGLRRPLVVRIANRLRRPVTVRRIATSVRSAPAGCPRRSLRLGRLRGRVRVPARGRRSVRLAARLHPDAANDCQGAAFALRLRAVGRAR